MKEIQIEKDEIRTATGTMAIVLAPEEQSFIRGYIAGRRQLAASEALAGADQDEQAAGRK